MERQKFEESFRKSFDNAEVPPSEKVWMNIELDLERLERGDMKKRLTFFKLLAAASVVFGLGLAGTGLYLLSIDRSTADLTAQQNQVAPAPDETPGIAQQQHADQQRSNQSSAIKENETTPLVSVESASEASSARPELPSSSSADQSLASADKPKNEDVATSNDNARTFDRNAVQRAVQGNVSNQRMAYADHVAATDEQSKVEFSIPAFRDRPLPPLVKSKTIVPNFPKTEPDQIDLLLASIAMEERAEADRKKYDGERIWTS